MLRKIKGGEIYCVEEFRHVQKRLEEISGKKIEATDDEVKAKIEEMAKNYGKEAKELEENENIKDYIKQGIENEKAMEFLVANSKEKKATKKATKEDK